MWPFLLHGQKVRIARIHKPIEKGKCYLFIHDNSILIHRLLKVLNGRAVFAGDYSEEIEEIPLEAVIGELKRNQNKIIICILNLINHIFICMLPACAGKIRIRNIILSTFIKFENRLNERKVRKTGY